MKHAWRQSDSWNTNIARLTSRLIQWNQDVYGNHFKRKRRLLDRLEGIDRALFQGPNERFFQLKKELWTQYNSILDQEEAYWFQQARSQWIRLGDRNTRYFHQKSLVRRRSNRIEALLNEHDEWVYAEVDIQQALISYFHKLFSSDISIAQHLNTICSYPLLPMIFCRTLQPPFPMKRSNSPYFPWEIIRRLDPMAYTRCFLNHNGRW